MELRRPLVAGAQVKGQAACDYGSSPPQSCPAVKSGTGFPKDRIKLPENEVRDDVSFPQLRAGTTHWSTEAVPSFWS